MKIQTMLTSACASLLTLVLAGCGSDPEPIVTETPSPSVSVTAEASPSATPSPSPSGEGELTDEELAELLPEEALLEDIRGAEATALFFLEQYAPMFHTGDTEVWGALSGPNCVFCHGASENAEELHAGGERGDGGEFVPRAGPHDLLAGDEGEVYVTVVSDVADSYTVDANGASRLTADASSVESTLKMERPGDVWIVADVRNEAVP